MAFTSGSSRRLPPINLGFRLTTIPQQPNHGRHVWHSQPPHPPANIARNRAPAIATFLPIKRRPSLARATHCSSPRPIPRRLPQHRRILLRLETHLQTPSTRQPQPQRSIHNRGNLRQPRQDNPCPPARRPLHRPRPIRRWVTAAASPFPQPHTSVISASLGPSPPAIDALPLFHSAISHSGAT
jgi:hypothetical protein